MFADHSGIKIENDYVKITGKFFKNWKLSKKQYTTKSIYQKLSLKGDKKYIELNEKENAMYQSLQAQREIYSTQCLH